MNEDTGAQTVPGWATAISAGPANESGQMLSFTRHRTSRAGHADLLRPGRRWRTTARSPTRRRANANGSGTFNVTLSDNGGTRTAA